MRDRHERQVGACQQGIVWPAGIGGYAFQYRRKALPARLDLGVLSGDLLGGDRWCKEVSKIEKQFNFGRLGGAFNVPLDLFV